MSSPPPPPATPPEAPSRPSTSLPKHTLSLSPPAPSHGDGTGNDAAPHPSSPSARTSYTHIDSKPEDEQQPHTSVAPQDLRTPPGPTPPLLPPQEQLTVSQDPLEARELTATSVSPSMTTSTEPGIVPPLASTNTTHASAGGTEESASSQKASVQTNQPQPLEPVPRTPQTFLTLLLVSGTRKTMSFEPETAIGRVKELIWNAWPTGKRTCQDRGTSCISTEWLQIGRRKNHLHLRISVCST
jgi:hypothetical protein